MKATQSLSAAAAIAAFSVLAPIAVPAQAEPSPAGSAGSGKVGLEEVIVTVRKVEELIQDVPISITAFSTRDLAEQSATNIQDITKLTPNIYVVEKRGNSAAVSFQIRGQYQNDILGTLDPSVGIYVDGVYWARAVGANAELVDIQSIQILKGPQGTLFGRNTTGGAVVMTTADPDFAGVSGSLGFTYGNLNQRTVSGVLNLPIIDDRVAFRIAGQTVRRDGYLKNVLDGSESGTRDRESLRAKLAIEATDTLHFLLSAESFDLDESQPGFKLVGLDPAVASNPSSLPNITAALGIGFQGTGPFGTSTTPEKQAALAAPRGSFAPWLALPFDKAAYSDTPVSLAKTRTYSGTATLDTEWGAIKAITAYRHSDNKNHYDLDGSPFDLISSQTEQEFSQRSAELQATGDSFFDEKLSFATGLFVFSERGRDFSANDALPLISPNNPSIFEGFIDNRSVAVYAQGTYALTDELHVMAGVRYVRDTKELESQNRTFSAAAGGFNCTVPVALRSNPAVCVGKLKNDYDAVPYTFGVDYKLADSTMVYAKTSYGFRSGGQNLRGGSGGPESFAPFDSEEVTDYEIGLKSELFSHRLRLNLAAFYSDYKNIQKSVLGNNSSGTVFTLVQNAGQARIYGGEMEVNALVTDSLQLGVTAGVVKPKYLEFTDPATGRDRSNEKFDAVPEFTGSLSATYTKQLGFGDLMLRSDYSYVDDVSLEQGQFPELASQDAYGLLNARIALTVLDGKLELALFGKNLTDEEYINESLVLAAPLGLVVVTPGSPRLYGASTTYRFQR